MNVTEEQLDRAFCSCGASGVCLAYVDESVHAVSYTFGDDGESIAASIDLDDGTSVVVVNTGSGYNCATTDSANPGDAICEALECEVGQDATSGLLSVDLSSCAASEAVIPAFIVPPSVFRSSQRLLKEDLMDDRKLEIVKKSFDGPGDNSIAEQLLTAARHEFL